MLLDGEFERGLNLEPAAPKKEELRGWKKKYFEEYWGEKQQTELRATEAAEEAKAPRHSFVAAAATQAHTIGAAASASGGGGVSTKEPVPDGAVPASPATTRPPAPVSDAPSDAEERPVRRSRRESNAEKMLRERSVEDTEDTDWDAYDTRPQTHTHTHTTKPGHFLGSHCLVGTAPQWKNW